MESIAQDRRTYDAAGRMHVRCRISKANVCTYLGREIGGWQALGLDPNRIYRMYRDPKALAEAAESFNNAPLLMKHVIVTADDIDPELIAGTVSNVSYEHPYLMGDVSAWTREAIDGIEDDSQKELSCAYSYVASMISGTSPDGVRYDGRMTGPIRANHVALVPSGRAGPDVVVADEALKMTTPSRFPKIMAALALVMGRAPDPEAVAAMDSALSKELAAAKDAFPELDDNEKKAACDAAMKSLGKDALSDEEERDAYQRAATDKKTAKDAAAKMAQDAAAVQVAVDAALATARDGFVSKADADKMAADAAAQARADVLALVTARDTVAEKVGVVALDSAEAVYRFALDHLKVSHADVPAAALPALYDRIAALPIAQDAALASAKPVDVRDLLPHLRNVRF